MTRYPKFKHGFAKKLITEYLTSSRLVTPKPCFLFSTLVSPHPFSTDCQARLRNGEIVTSEILINLKRRYDQDGPHLRFPIYFNRGLYVELVGEILLLLDDCGDTSDIENWEERDDGLNPVDNQVYVKQGSHSMALEIDADLSANVFAQWRNEQSQGDLSAYEHDWVYIWIYIPTLEYLATPGYCLEYQIGSSSGDRLAFRWLKAALTVGWNLLKADLDDPFSSIGTIDWLDIDFLNIRVNEVAGNTHDFTIYVDSIMFVRPFSGATDGITEGVTVQYLIE